MKAFLAILIGVAIAATAALTSCQHIAFDGDKILLPGVDLPVEIGIQYELEEDLSILILPGDKGGLEVSLLGEGELSDAIKKIPGGFEVESPLTGLIYRITSGTNGKPRIMIVGGTGKIKPVTPVAGPVEILPEK